MGVFLRRLLTIILLIFWGKQAASLSPISVENPLTKKEIGGQIEYLVDKKNQLDIGDIALGAPSLKWQKSREKNPNFGISSYTYFFRFTLKQKAILKEDILLEIGYPLLDHVELYMQGSPKAPPRLIGRGGDNFPFKDRHIKYRNMVFKIDLKENEAKTYYLKARSNGSMQLPLILWSKKSFAESKILESAGFGLYYGLLLVMILYNFFLAVTVRDKIYLLYTFYISSYLMAQAGLNGFSFMFIWPDAPKWSNSSLPFFMLLSVFSMLLFSLDFLQTKDKSKKTYQAAKILMVFQLLGVLLSFFLPYRWAANYTAITVAATGIILTIASLKSLHQGYRPAKFFLIAFSMLILGGLTLVLKNVGLLPAFFLTTYAMQIGSAMEIVLLSLAMGDKIRGVQLENQKEIDSLNKDLIKLNKDLMEKDRARTLFFQNTSHELRTPLNGIIGFCDLLITEAYGKIGVKAAGSVGKIKELSLGLKDLVNSILDLASSKKGELKLNASKFLVTNIKDAMILLREGLLKEYPESRLSLKCHFKGDATFIQDEDKILTVTRNLVANALKFRRPDSINNVVLSIRLLSEKEALEIKVSDEGIGIANENLAVIFDEFKQVDREANRSYEGSGLGLPLSKAMVELMGGSLSVTSKEGFGSVFTALIPKAAGSSLGSSLVGYDHKKEGHPIEALSDAAEEEEIEGNEVIKPPFIADKKENADFHVLVVDDIKTNVEVLEMLVGGQGYRVSKAYGGREAISKIEKDPPDLVLLDLMMPEVSGEDVLNWIKKNPELSSMAVIILTARSSHHDRMLHLAKGADDYLAKPLDSGEVLYRVQNILQRQKKAQEKGALQQRIESDKMIGLGTMAAGIAHEINNPLAIISGSTRILHAFVKKGDYENPNIFKNIDRINHEIDRIAKIISSLKTYSRDAKQDPFTLVSIESCILDTLSLCESKIRRKGIDVTYTQLEKELYIDCRPSEICQILLNLINNAADEVEGKEKPWIRVEVTASEEFVDIRVIDCGHGISEDVLQKIFDPFYTLKDVGKGTGLGLSISKRLALNHGGKLVVEKESKNTAFLLSLPKAAAPKKEAS